MDTINSKLDELEEHGFVVIEGGLSPEEVERCRVSLNTCRANGWENGLNDVGNMWFDTLLERMPEVFSPLIAHPSVRPYLDALYGPQCELRSLRGHINPGPYLQEWHMDFTGYWKQKDSARYGVKGTGVNTTFYFQDNGPNTGRLTFVKGGHKFAPPEEVVTELGWQNDCAAFDAWANSMEHEVIYPKAGDVVLFFSHIPHQGAKMHPEIERSNVVCHYQNNPFYANVAHVSQPIGAPGIYPIDG